MSPGASVSVAALVLGSACDDPFAPGACTTETAWSPSALEAVLSPES